MALRQTVVMSSEMKVPNVQPGSANFVPRVPDGDNRMRQVCADCGFINYENPKIVESSRGGAFGGVEALLKMNGLTEQLAEGGRLILPVGCGDQTLVLVERTPRGLRETRLNAVRFVPLLPGVA